MKITQMLQGVAASLAAVGLLLPPGWVHAETSPIQSKRQVNKLAADVVLQQGQFTGRVVDHQGHPLAGRKVTVFEGQKVIAESVTNERGIFSIKDLKPGQYVASSGNTAGVFRVWSESSAPPSAKGHALLVMGENGGRGQFGAIDPALVLLTAATIAAVVISAITLDRVNEIDDKIPQSP